MKNKFRQRIHQEKERLKPEVVFTSEKYQKMLRTLTKVLTDSEFDEVTVSLASDSKMAGCYGPEGIFLYPLNDITKSYPTLELKSRSMVGILAHECGHKNFSSTEARHKYLEGIEEGVWYPRPPRPVNEEEQEYLEQMKKYFVNKDTMVLHIVSVTASYIQNILEDVYVENLMCSRFSGSITHGIWQNRERKLELIPSLTEQLQEGYDNLAVMVNLIAQYALSGQYNNWDGYEGAFVDVLESAKDVIDDAVIAEGGSRRIIATNQILLKMWKILQQEIDCLLYTSPSPRDS